MPDAELLNIVQRQLLAQGIHSFDVTHVSPDKHDVRRYLQSRIQLFAERQPDARVLRMVRPALERLAVVPETETIYRWEANSSLGRIVGYSTATTFLGVFPYVMREDDWVACIIRF